MSPQTLSERMMGCFIGLVAGDAFGASYEFFSRATLVVAENFTSDAREVPGFSRGEGVKG